MSGNSSLVCDDKFQFFNLGGIRLFTPSANYFDSAVVSILDSPADTFSLFLSYFTNTIWYWLPLLSTPLLGFFTCCRLRIVLPTGGPSVLLILFLGLVLISFFFAFDTIVAINRHLCESAQALMAIVHTFQSLIDLATQCLSLTDGIDLSSIRSALNSVGTFELPVLYSAAAVTIHVVVLGLFVLSVLRRIPCIRLVTQTLLICLSAIASIVFLFWFASSQVTVWVESVARNDSLILSSSRCVITLQDRTFLPCQAFIGCLDEEQDRFSLASLFGYSSIIDFLLQDEFFGGLLNSTLVTTEHLDFLADLLLNRTTFDVDIPLLLQLADEASSTDDLLKVLNPFIPNPTNGGLLNGALSLANGDLFNSPNATSDLFGQFTTRSDFFSLNAGDPSFGGRRQLQGSQLRSQIQTAQSCAFSTIYNLQNVLRCSQFRDLYDILRPVRVQGSLLLFYGTTMVTVVVGFVFSVTKIRLRQRAQSQTKSGEEDVSQPPVSRAPQHWIEVVDPLEN